LQKKDLAENNLSTAIYIESNIDGNSYCKTNGQFTQHLRKNNLTYRDYYEKYVTKISPKCNCGERLAFYQKTESYANSCGAPKCRGESISKTKQNWSDEQKNQDKANKKLAAASRSKDQIEKQVQKARKTFKEKYGVEWISNLKEQKEKSQQTKLEKYGDVKYNNSKQASLSRISRSIEEKNTSNQQRRNTNLERYGIENVLLNKSTPRKVNKGNASIKDYIMPSRKVIGVRGHEPFALDILFNELKYNESDIIVHDDYSDYSIEIFEYEASNRHQMKYYPDIYIPKENRIIEIKSRWWWDGYGAEKYRSRLENNLRKRQSVINKGYNYEVWIFENKYSYKVLNDKDF
jgi:hypothetical protein